MIPARSLPMLATVLAALVLVAWMSLSAGPETSLFNSHAAGQNSASPAAPERRKTSDRIPAVGVDRFAAGVSGGSGRRV